MVNNPLSPVNMGIYNDFCPQSARRKWRKYAFSSKKACTLRAKIMYKTPDYEYEQLSFTSFNATCGMQLDPDNEPRSCCPDPAKPVLSVLCVESLQVSDRLLPRKSACRSNLSNALQHCVLQRKWYPNQRPKAWSPGAGCRKIKERS